MVLVVGVEQEFVFARVSVVVTFVLGLEREWVRVSFLTPHFLL